jgi:hypothetical protein
MNKILDKYVGNLVVIMAVVSYFDLFKFVFIPFSFQVYSQILTLGLMILLIILRIIYLPPNRVKMNFSIPILLLLIGSIPSMFIAQVYHNQSFIISIFANRFILFYLLYFFVHFYRINTKFVLHLIVFIGLFAVSLYYIQYTLYPKQILNIGIIEGRGTIRLFVAGMLCSQVAYFYFLNRFFKENRITYLLLSFLTLSIFVLQGTRQLIFGLAFLTLINLLFAKRIKSRFLITLTLSVAIVAVYFVFREIFIELTQVSSSQMQQMGEGIRLKAARYFLTDFMPSSWAYIFGNSEAGPGSIYGQRQFILALNYGYYITDLGILGDYITYGLVFVIAGLFMLIKALRFRINNSLIYLKFYILSQCFTIITGKGIFGGVDIIMLLILYVFDVYRSETLSNSLTLDNHDEVKLTS